MTIQATTIEPNRLGQLLVGLFQGVQYRDADSALWQALMELQARVRDYCATIGLELILDEAEGYAYLRQRASAPDEPELPRLVQRRQLSYPVSLILALLRKKLAEFDATGGETRLVVDRDQNRAPPRQASSKPTGAPSTPARTIAPRAATTSRTA